MADQLGRCAAAAACGLALLLAGCGGGAEPPAAAAAGVLKADAAAPFTGDGTWWNPAEPGTGFFFEAQGATGVVTFFVFDAAGRPTWVSAAGPFTAQAGGFRFEATLQKFSGGQPVGSTMARTPAATPVGAVTIVFNGAGAQVTLPQRSFTAQKFHTGAGATAGLQPETGIFWNADESGRGYTVEVLGDTISWTMFHYDDRGEPTWHLAVAPLRHGAFNAPFLRYSGGQTLGGPYVAPAAPQLDGTLGASFSQPCAASLWLPNMPARDVRRFAFGSLPAGAECRAAARTPADGPAVAAAQSVLAHTAHGLVQPAAIAVDGAGNAYVADEAQHAVYRIAPGGGATVFAGLPGDPGYVNARGSAARFSRPLGIAVDAAGVVYVVDRGNLALRRIAPDGTVTTLAGSPGQPGAIDGPIASARFGTPSVVRVDAAGTLYIVDGASVRKLQGGVLTTVLGGTATTRALGNGTQAGFYIVQSVAVDAAGRMVVSEYDTTLRGWLRKFDADGTMLPLANTPDGTLSLPFPTDVAVDAGGNAYVLSNGTLGGDSLRYGALYKITASTAMTRYGGDVVPTYPVPTTFSRLLGAPAGVALDAQGRVVAADAAGAVWQFLP